MPVTCANLTAYWKLEETGSGATRVDSKGTNHLGVVGTAITSAAGILGNAAVFDNVTRLSILTAPDLTCAGNIPFSLSAWFYLPSTAVQVLVCKGNGAGDIEYILNTDGSNHLIFRCRDGTTLGTVTTTATWSTSTWTHVAAWYDLSNLYCAINNGTPASTAYTLGSYNGGHGFALGATFDGGSTIDNGGRLDEVSFWRNYAFTSGDVATLYNGGAAYGYDALCPLLGDPFPARSIPPSRAYAPFVAR